MSSIVSRRASVLALAAVVTLAGCAKPPADAITAAEAAQQAAVAAGAEEYAPEALNAVAEAKAALDAELAAQAEKSSFTRSYDRAAELVAAYQAAADQATSAAATAKQQAEQEATAFITEGRASLDEVTTLLASAPRGKGSAADLAAMQADLEGAGLALTEAETALTAGSFLEARTKAASARDVIQRVRDAVTQAQTARR